MDGVFERKKPGGKTAAWSAIWLVYLGIYFIPWFGRPPTAMQLGAAIVGVGTFLAIYFDAYAGRRRSLLPHVLGMVAIGFALAPFGGVWSVFEVFACSLTAGAFSRRNAIIGIALITIGLAGFGLAFRISWVEWAPGMFFGVMASAGNLIGADLQRRNQQLLETQDEVRALSAIAERERIARDLHDLLGHTLTLVAVKAELATRLAERDPEAARREMEAVAEVARDALGQVRDAVSGMAYLSFAGEIERARAMLGAASVEARINTPAGLADPKREAVLAMALREAVTNVIRHAHAGMCSIDLESRPNGDLRLRVADDGRGGEFEEGSGLRGMRARLFAAGGALEVTASPTGACLTATLPGRAAA